MNSYVNSALSSNSDVFTSEYKSNSEYSKKSQKKKHIISEQKGKYLYTYLVDVKGNKFLLSKALINQSKNTESTKCDEIKDCKSDSEQNNNTDFDLKQQMHIENVHRKNTREKMNILKENAGIVVSSKKHY